MPVSKGGKKEKDKKDRARAGRPTTGVLLDPELAAELLSNVPPELLPPYTLLYAWQTMSAGRPANTCTTACLSLQAALAWLGDRVGAAGRAGDRYWPRAQRAGGQPTSAVERHLLGRPHG